MSDERAIDTEIERTGEGGVRFERVRMVRSGSDIEVQFDLSWDGSWGYLGEARGNNWDAAWVFFKYSYSGKQILELTDAMGAALDACDVGEFVRLMDEQSSVRVGSFDDSGSAEGRIQIVEPGHSLSGRVSLSTVRRGQSWILSHYHAPELPPQRLQLSKVPGADGEPAKLSMATDTAWLHALVKGEGLPPPDGGLVDDTEDRAGVFVRRSPENKGGPGPVTFRDVRLKCQLGLLDLELFSGKVQLWPFAIEMVHIPEGPFWLGDPQGGNRGAPQNCFYDALTPREAKNRAYRIESEDAIEVGAGGRHPGATKVLHYSNDDDAGGAGDQRGPIPAAFPKGYRAYYLMKRQVTQGQYADFINTLSGGEPWSYGQLLRYSYDGHGSFRGTITIANKTLTRVATRPLRAHNHLCWGDSLAFAAWAGLRPMTELEYEKACRGPLPPVNFEYSWGTSNSFPGQVIQGEEDGTEVVTGNCNLGNGSTPFSGGDGECGPVRDDAFSVSGGPKAAGTYTFMTGRDGGDPHTPGAAADRAELESTSALGDRENSGLSFYGVAALTGNLWECCVTVGHAEGREFTGQHGKGELDRGEVPYKALKWPAPTGKGPSWRGGSWYTSAGRGPVAARGYGSGAPGYYMRSHDAGFRAARTAPDKKKA